MDEEDAGLNHDFQDDGFGLCITCSANAEAHETPAIPPPQEETTEVIEVGHDKAYRPFEKQ